MLYIANKRCKRENLSKRYPGALIVDVTSHAGNSLKMLSPFYPHGDIPVPFSPGVTSACVEAVWQGLKVFRDADVDTSLFSCTTMKNIKRSVRKYGAPLGHRKGVAGQELLSYFEARVQIYLPTYKWMLENKVSRIVERLKAAAEKQDVVLLDYNTNENIRDLSKPLSHAGLVKAFIEGHYPDGNDTEEPHDTTGDSGNRKAEPKKVRKSSKRGKKRGKEVAADMDAQMSMF